MDNLLPTITVLMAEASVVLLLLLGILCWRYLRRKRQHEAEIETMIAMAQGREITLPAGVAPPESIHTPIQPTMPEPEAEATAQPIASESTSESASENMGKNGSDGDTPEPEQSSTPPRQPIKASARTSGRPSAGAAEPMSAAASAAIAAAVAQQEQLGEFLKARLAEIRHAQELMDTKLNQIRHDHQKLAANIFRALEKSAKDVADSRHEMEAMHQLLGQLRKRIIASSSIAPAPTARSATPPPEAAPAPAPVPESAPEPSAAAAQQPTEPRAPDASKPPSASPARDQSITVAEGLSPNDPDLILDREILDRLSAPDDARPGNGGIAVEEISLDDLDPQDIREAISGKNSPFATPAQVFFQSSTTEDMPQGWYFSVHGGAPQGPFTDKLTAELVMEEVACSTVPPRREVGTGH